MHPLRVIQKKLKLKEYFLFTFLLLRSEKSRLSPFFKTIFWHKNWMTFKLNTSETGVWIKRRKYFNLTILLSLGSNQIISRLFFSISQNDKKKCVQCFLDWSAFPHVLNLNRSFYCNQSLFKICSHICFASIFATRPYQALTMHGYKTESCSNKTFTFIQLVPSQSIWPKPGAWAKLPAIVRFSQLQCS